MPKREFHPATVRQLGEAPTQLFCEVPIGTIKIVRLGFVGHPEAEE
jgi:hypothetical protein